MLTHYTASNTQHQMTIIIIILATQMAAQKTQNTAVVKFLTKKHKNIFKTVYVIGHRHNRPKAAAFTRTVLLDSRIRCRT